MSKKDPLRWMPWDVVAWLLSRRVASLSPLARGVYFELLNRQWYDGSLPSDDDGLAVCARVTSEEWAAVKKSVLPFFESDENGGLRQSRCEQEKRAAKKRLSAFQKRTKNASKARWQKRTKDNALLRDGIRYGSATEEQDRTGQDKTGQYHPPKPPTDVPAKPTEPERIPPPTASQKPYPSMTVFDQEQECKVMLKRYDALGPDRRFVDETFQACSGHMRPGGRLIFLRDFEPFPVGQILLAAKAFLALTAPPHQPSRYFFGMVRNAGKEWAARENEAERKAEAREQNRRVLDAVKQRSLDNRPSKAGNIAGNILKSLETRKEQTT